MTEECRPGVFRLTDKDGMQVPNVWNIEHLRKFYPKIGESRYALA